jgi:hypothetical protein
MKNCIKMESIPPSQNVTITVTYYVSLTVDGEAKVDVGTSAAVPFHTTQTLRHRSAATGINPEKGKSLRHDLANQQIERHSL